jgi:hypothetical protein
LSYDLYFVRVAAGQDPAVVAEAALAAEEDGINPGPIDPAIEDRKRAIAAALIQADPTLRISAFEFAEIAALQGVSETEARRANRHLELDAGLESRTGIQITLFDDTAALTVPYWHHDAAMREVWSEIWKYVGVLKHAGAFVAYDPQIERIVDQARDADAVLVSYAGGVTFTDGVAKDLTHGLPARPWWKFWSRGA